MDDSRLLRNLQSVGMRIFVEYFDSFSDNKLSAGDVVEHLFRNEEFTEKSCRSRTGHAKAIINAGRAGDALRLITKASPGRVDVSVRKNATQLLADSKSCMPEEKSDWSFSCPDDGTAFPEHLIELVWS